MILTTVYVIASNEDKAEAKRLMADIAFHGYHVHNWTAPRPGVPFERKTADDFTALMTSDVVFIIDARRVTPGKFIEIGACVATHKTIFAIEHSVPGVFKKMVPVITTTDVLSKLLAFGERSVPGRPEVPDVCDRCNADVYDVDRVEINSGVFCRVCGSMKNAEQRTPTPLGYVDEYKDGKRVWKVVYDGPKPEPPSKLCHCGKPVIEHTRFDDEHDPIPDNCNCGYIDGRLCPVHPKSISGLANDGTMRVWYWCSKCKRHWSLADDGTWGHSSFVKDASDKICPDCEN